MTLIRDDSEINQSLRYERITLAIFISIITSFMLFDILDDWYEGASLYHLLPELLIAIFGMGSAAYLFMRFAKKRHIALYTARKELAAVRSKAEEWQNHASTFRKGLTEAINTQLAVWGMTEAEQEISFLLLKGFSLQEIADLRSTSERTVRQQASIIYKKSGLTGRIQLSAFFLEDLLMPSPE